MALKGSLFVGSLTQTGFWMYLCIFEESLFSVDLLTAIRLRFPDLGDAIDLLIPDALQLVGSLADGVLASSGIGSFPRDVAADSQYPEVGFFQDLTSMPLITIPFTARLRFVEWRPIYKLLSVYDDFASSAVFGKFYRAYYSKINAFRDVDLFKPRDPFVRKLFPDGVYYLPTYDGFYGLLTGTACQTITSTNNSSDAFLDYYGVWGSDPPFPSWHFLGTESEFSIVVYGDTTEGFRLAFHDSGSNMAAAFNGEYPETLPAGFYRTDYYQLNKIEYLQPVLDGITPRSFSFPVDGLFVPEAAVFSLPVSGFFLQVLMIGQTDRINNDVQPEDDMIIGMPVLWLGSVAPAKCVLAGSEISHDDYPDLCEVFGVTAGSLTLPNPLNKSVVIGATPGASGGNNSVSLVVDNLPQDIPIKGDLPYRTDSYVEGSHQRIGTVDNRARSAAGLAIDITPAYYSFRLYFYAGV